MFVLLDQRLGLRAVGGAVPLDRAGPPGPALRSRNQFLSASNWPARGPAADGGVRPTIYADAQQPGKMSGIGQDWVGGFQWVCSDRKSTRLNSSHLGISYAVFCLKKKTSTTQKLISLLGSAACRCLSASWSTE